MINIYNRYTFWSIFETVVIDIYNQRIFGNFETVVINIYNRYYFWSLFEILVIDIYNRYIIGHF